MTMKKTGKSSKDPRQPAESKAAPARPQAEIFSEAMRAFWASQYERAIELFEQAAQGRDLSIAESAQMHFRMCRRRMESSMPELKTPEQQHLYAVSLINEQRFADALPWLQKAGFKVEDIRNVYYPGLEKGLIIRQNPPGGYPIQKRNPINLEVSR